MKNWWITDEDLWRADEAISGSIVPLYTISRNGTTPKAPLAVLKRKFGGESGCIYNPEVDKKFSYTASFKTTANQRYCFSQHKGQDTLYAQLLDTTHVILKTAESVSTDTNGHRCMEVKGCLEFFQRGHSVIGRQPRSPPSCNSDWLTLALPLPPSCFHFQRHQSDQYSESSK